MSESESDGESESCGGNQIQASAVRTNFYPNTSGPLCKLLLGASFSMYFFVVNLLELFVLWEDFMGRNNQIEEASD